MSRLAILYGAKSTADAHGSIPTQLADTRAMAEREGFEVVESFKDEARSAYSGNRGPDLAAAKARAAELAAEGHEVAIFVQHSDRIARGDGVSAAQVIQHFWDAKRDGYAFRSVQDSSTFSDDEESGGLMAFVMGLRNHADSKRKSAAVKAGKRRAAERKEPHGGWAAYGLRYGRRDEGETPGLHVVPERAEIVRRVFREWRSGVSQKAIGRALNRDGVKPDRTEKWGQSTIGRMLRNPIYAGHRWIDDEAGGERKLVPVTIHPEPIISYAEYEEAQRLLAPPGTGKRSGRPAAGFLLRNLLICGICGGPMHCRRGKLHGRPREGYSCYTRHKDPTACSQKEVPRARIDEGVLEYFETVCLDAEASWAAYRASVDARLMETQSLRETAERESIRLVSQLDRADEDYGSGKLDAEDYSQLKRKWEEQCKAADAEVERLREREAEIDTEASPDFRERLVRIREAVAARVRDARDDEGIEAIRAALATVFEGFELTQAPTTEPDEKARYIVVPRLRVEAIGAPSPPRVTVRVAPDESEMSHVAEALSYRMPADLAAA